MDIDVHIQGDIKSDTAFRVRFHVDPAKPANATITVSVDGEARNFGMKRGTHVLPPGMNQTIDIGAGDPLWTITDWGQATPPAMVTVDAKDGTRTGSDSGAVQ